jgi:hypothetical protein
VEAGFQPASDGRILASSPIAAGGRDAALLAGWKPASTVLVVLTRCARQAAEVNFLLAKGGAAIYSRVAVGKRKVALWM